MEEVYSLINIFNNKSYGIFTKSALKKYFECDSIKIEFYAETGRIIGDRYRIYPSNMTNVALSSVNIHPKELRGKEDRLSYIARHLEKYGNCAVCKEDPTPYFKELDDMGYSNLDIKYVKPNRKEGGAKPMWVVSMPK